jgi:hypothetical protein
MVMKVIFHLGLELINVVFAYSDRYWQLELDFFRLRFSHGLSGVSWQFGYFDRVENWLSLFSDKDEISEPILQRFSLFPMSFFSLCFLFG